MEKEKRNGTIELLRFLFCMAVLFFHISKDIYGEDWTGEAWGGVMRYGALGVEFFFITSGYFMANSVSKMAAVSQNLVKETWLFLWKKVKPILPYHIAFNAVMFVFGIMQGYTLEEHIHRASCFFFLPTVGFHDWQWLLGAEWYIGCMLFGMLLIYPFLRRWTEPFIGYAAPILTMILYGYMAYHDDSVMESNRLVQAFASLLLGITVFSVSSHVGRCLDRSDTRGLQWLIRWYPVGVIVLFLAYMNTSLDRSVQAFLVLLLASGLTVSFGRQGRLSRTGLLDNRVVYWLGRISLPIYMIQNITRKMVRVLVENQTVPIYYFLESAVTIVCGIFAYYVWKWFSTYIGRERMLT